LGLGLPIAHEAMSQPRKGVRLMLMNDLRGKAVIKSFAVLVVLALTVLFASSAAAHNLTVASATTNCTGGCLSVSADSLTPGDMDKITYTFTLTSTTGGPPITISSEIDFTADNTGTFSTTVCFSWLASGNLSDSYTVTGSATLTTPSNETSTLPVDLGGGNNTLTCGSTPPGKSFSIGPS